MRRMPYRCMTPAVKNLINQALRIEVFHVHLKRRFDNQRECHLNTVLLEPAALDAVVHESNQPGCNNSAKPLVFRSEITWLEPSTHSATSIRPCLILSSQILIEHGGTQPPIDSSSSASSLVIFEGKISAIRRDDCISTRR